jgi:ribonucleoside-triphosphate reductase
MFTEIEKRDGNKAAFKAEKITSAIAKAGKATGEFDEKVAKRLTIKVLNLSQQVIGDKVPTVEEVQDIVEEILLDKASVDLVDQYLKRTDWRVNENSNMAFSLQGLNNYVSSEVSKVYWLNEIYSPEVREAHIQGDFHIHDLNLLSVYCVGWDLFDLLVEGFRGVWGRE